MTTPTEFTLTEEHLALIQRMYVYWNDEAYDGAPAVGLKRPYGNSDVPGDVIDILGWPTPWLDEDDDVPEHVEERALAVHRETEVALQIVIMKQSFTPGTYVRPDLYDTRTWVLKESTT